MTTIPAISKLSNNIIRILGCNPGPFTLQGTNTYLIGTGRKRILLDTGDKDIKEYQSNLQKVMANEKATIEHIIITHWHHDHIGGIEDIYANIAINSKIWKHKRSDDPEKDILPTKINWLNDGQVIKVEGATVKVHHTPGHTTDHVVLSLVEDNVLFSGDCILGEGTAVFEDLQSYMISLKKIMEIKPEVIYPGHGNVVEEPISKINHYINHRNQRESQIIDVLKNNPQKQMTEMDLVDIIYTDTPENLKLAAANNVNHHLVKLTKENKIRLIDGHTKKWQYNPTSSL